MALPRVRRDCQCPRARHTHGTRGAYLLDKCRCFPCRKASSDAQLRNRLGVPGACVTAGMWVPAVGVTRRIQALQACGWRLEDIGAACGMTKQAVASLRDYPSDRRSTVAAGKIRAAYDLLWDKPPTNKYAARCRRDAAANGWALPAEWDDDELDLEDARPHQTARTASGPSAAAIDRDDRRAQVAELHRVGLERAVIAHRLSITPRTVERDLKALREAAGVAA